MSTGAARKALYAEVLAAWQAATDLPAVLDNEPDRGVDKSGGYLQVMVRHGGSEQITLGPGGARRYTRNGLCFATVRVPLNRNLDAGDRLAEAVRGRMQGRTLAADGVSVWTFAADVQEQGPVEGYYWIVVEIPFQFEVRA